MGILVIGATFLDIKGFPEDTYIPDGRNVGRIEYVHGGVSRNVVEDIANMELRPTYLSIVDDSPLGEDVINKLKNHKVNTDYIIRMPGGMGTFLAIFDNSGNLAGSISQRPNLDKIMDVLEEKGDEIVGACDSIVIEVDMDKDIVKKILNLAEAHGKQVFGVVANMSLAAHRRDLISRFSCFICNELEAGILFADDYTDKDPEQMSEILSEKVTRAMIPSMIVTLGDKGAVYADKDGNRGTSPARNVQVRDTTGAGDAFCSGVAIGLTYGKSLADSCELGSFLAGSVITSTENVCPRFLPGELGLDIEVEED
ncbi:MAG: carbohydrate kinase family protein [Lachnospiraceae bacterium]|nr:carbohydrate kinase family protein [Lachnospiraceae bacterium]